MLIGIMSDTHDDMEQIKKAVQLLNSKRAGLVLHAGDIVSPFTFEVLGDLQAEFAGIFGNNDGDKLLLMDRSLGRLTNQPLVRDAGGKRLVVVHEPDMANSLAKSGDFDIVIYGHLHKPDVRQVGGALIINPGKVARLHKGESTLALLETDTMRAEIVAL
jgi:putative phosphoesterase